MCHEIIVYYTTLFTHCIFFFNLIKVVLPVKLHLRSVDYQVKKTTNRLLRIKLFYHNDTSLDQSYLDGFRFRNAEISLN